MNKSDKIKDIIDNVRRLFQTVNEYSRTAERATGLTGPQLWVVKLLASYTSMRVSQLATHMYLSPATVVGIVDRLENKGLVMRVRSKADRRVVDVSLTEAGVSLAENSPEVAQSMLITRLETLSEIQFGTVEEGIKLMVQMLGIENITPQPLHS